MPTSARERIDRITSHLSASSCRGKVTSGAPSSRTTMQNNLRPPVTSHALDTAIGKPAQGLPLKLEQLVGEGKGNWLTLGSSETNNDGRAPSLLAPGSVLERATYRVTFDTEAYFHSTGAPCFYPEVTVVFRIEDPSQHYHIPLLISPFGYSTYRGS